MFPPILAVLNRDSNGVYYRRPYQELLVQGSYPYGPLIVIL